MPRSEPNFGMVRTRSDNEYRTLSSVNNDGDADVV